jgi:HD superfamily phosphohydrolase
MREAAEIRDPIHGYIHINDLERELIDNQVFQRLRRIRQLSGAHLTYPGAQHSRFEHSIGCLHLAGLAGLILARETGLGHDEQQQLRLAALLHDVGHGPFSHTFEEVLALRGDVSHEDLTARIVSSSALGEILRVHGYDSHKLAKLAIATSDTHPKYMNDVLGGVLSVDLMDYLLRDSYFTGVEYGKVDVHRVINSYTVADGELALDQAAVYAFEALMIARYEMFRAVYFHRTVRAAELMLAKALELADEHLSLTDVSDLDRFLELTDENVLDRIALLRNDDANVRIAKEWVTAYRNRQLLKCVFEKPILRKDRFFERILSQKSIREEIVSKLADSAKVSSDYVFVDVSTTPSVPLTSSREALANLRLTSEGHTIKKLDVRDFPIAGSIIGFFDMLRIYTTAQLRDKVGAAALQFFGEDRDSENKPWHEKVSM